MVRVRFRFSILLVIICMLSVFLLNVFGYFISSQFNGFLAFMVTFK